DENGETLLDGPAHEGFLRREIENVELVDPRRHDEQRDLTGFLGRGRVLDEFKGRVSEYDLSGRGGEILADFEGVEIGLADAQAPVRRLHVLLEMFQSLDEIGAV